MSDQQNPVSHRVDTKIGDAEFHAEGSEAFVKDSYEHFIRAVIASAEARRSIPPGRSAFGGIPVLSPPLPPQDPPPSGQPAAANGNGGEVTPEDAAFLNEIFLLEGEGDVSLRVLPEGEARIAEAAILLLYGYRRLRNAIDVPITALNRGLRESGLSFDRLDYKLVNHNQYIAKGGSRSGARLRLNNQGVNLAQQILARLR